MKKYTKVFLMVGILLFLIYWSAFGLGTIKKDSSSINAEPTSSTPSLTLTNAATGAKEIAYIQQKLNDSHVPTYYTTCVRYVTGETKAFYQVEVHEYHNEGSCPGAKGVSPLAAMFRISKIDNSITYYDVIKDKFIPFSQWIAQLSTSKN